MSRGVNPTSKGSGSRSGLAPRAPMDSTSHREFNGATQAGAIVKFGGRMFVDPPRFLEWMATQPRISPPVKRAKAPAQRGRRSAPQEGRAA